ncbi:MAG: hypothetical protein L6275_03535, partial [Candidatus Portnoybacteria bacterium]|nr:hypothetical protein [Candidatus Portnoybacteria bacterium]
MIFFQKTILQRFASTTLIVCLLFSIVGTALLLPKKAEAFPCENTETLSWTTVFQTVLDNVWNYIKSSYDKLSDLSLKKIAAWTIWKKAQDLITWAAAVLLNVLLHQILAQLTNDITAWIQNGTEPRFLSEGLGDWLGRAANNAGGNFVDQYLGAGWLCEPFDLDIKIALRDVPTFETEAECTLTDIVDNIDDFYDDFTTGGWKGWIELTKPQNTFAGAYLLAKDEKMLVMDKEIKEMEKDLDMGEGFLSPKDCYWYSADGDLVETQTDVWGSPSLPSDCQPDPNNKGFTTAGYTAPCSKICQINTPASVVKDVASKSITTAFDKMNTYIGAALSKTGPYAVYIQAIADALINRILTEGKGLLQADAVPSP